MTQQKKSPIRLVTDLHTGLTSDEYDAWEMLRMEKVVARRIARAMGSVWALQREFVEVGGYQEVHDIPLWAQPKTPIVLEYARKHGLLVVVRDPLIITERGNEVEGEIQK